MVRVRPALILTAIAGLAIGASAAAAGEQIYLFYLRKDLAHTLATQPDTLLGKKVVFTDELIVIWPRRPEERHTTIDGTEHVPFDTTYFKCLVPRGAMGEHLSSIFNDARKGYEEVMKKLETVTERLRKRELTLAQANADRRRLNWELYRIWSNKPIVTVYGTVDRAELWGPVQGRGVDTERVVIVADKIEKPRRRWYESLDE